VKATVVLCDICKNRIAKLKCEICGADLCEQCRSKIKIDERGLFGFAYTHLNGVIVCEECLSKHTKLVQAALKSSSLHEITKSIFKTINKHLSSVAL